MHAECRRSPPPRLRAMHAGCRAMRLSARQASPVSGIALEAPYTWPALRQCMRVLCLGQVLVPCPIHRHAMQHVERPAPQVGVDAISCKEPCDANAVMTSRRNSAFPRLSTMSFCKLASIANAKRVRGLQLCSRKG